MLKNRIISVLICIMCLSVSITGLCASREEMEENFFRTWSTKMLGIDDIMRPLGVFAIRKQYNHPDSLFFMDHITRYDNQPESEYDYYGVLYHKDAPQKDCFMLLAGRVDRDGYVINASPDTPFTTCVFYLVLKDGEYGFCPHNTVVNKNKAGDDVKRIDNPGLRYACPLFKDTAAEMVIQKFKPEVSGSKYYPYQ